MTTMNELAPQLIPLGFLPLSTGNFYAFDDNVGTGDNLGRRNPERYREIFEFPCPPNK